MNNELVSKIGPGLSVLLGISRDDTQADLEYIVRKILNLRLFDEVVTESGASGAASIAAESTSNESESNDKNTKRWRSTVMDNKYEVLCVSQFTLQGKLKGNKVDFHSAMASDQSRPMYDTALRRLAELYKPDKIKPGAFGEKMLLLVENDGPVTILLDSKNKQGAADD